MAATSSISPCLLLVGCDWRFNRKSVSNSNWADRLDKYLIEVSMVRRSAAAGALLRLAFADFDVTELVQLNVATFNPHGQNLSSRFVAVALLLYFAQTGLKLCDPSRLLHDFQISHLGLRVASASFSFFKKISPLLLTCLNVALKFEI